MDIRKLDRAAVLESVRVLEWARPGHWDAPTPCGDWTVRQLVAHMAGQHDGFAAAATGGGAALRDWEPAALGEDPLGTYRASAEAVLTAFDRPGVLNREFRLPEISTTMSFPASVAIGFHFLDYVVHGWDLARALGLDLELSTEAAETALAVALRVPDDERRLGPGAQFRPALAPAPGAPTFDLVLTTLGRSPDWSAPAADRLRSTDIHRETFMLDELRTHVARRLGLSQEEVFAGQPLSAVLVASPTAINSIDLLDAFAGALADAGADADVELPTMTLDHTAEDVVVALDKQLTSTSS
ncbi:TIGR03086 family metal-binding protein [Streptomyces sp. AM 4-1-1]|uniref:TIGR03086 family metal-binding protein n=1 Tax=Streptomyces sp. AM 4-1-1 TaxID=3028710 RepID=UPI0023BA1B9B|nr:TIGR03086 family metal-binding protein [Streptomyces sp. AM 4-1-1]WEH32315.1 TIGR03086 family metal-binding protein [Streptomyces sp. AM 4-1-1]